MAAYVCKMCENFTRPSNMVDNVCRKCLAAHKHDLEEDEAERDAAERKQRIEAERVEFERALSKVQLTTETAHNLPIAKRVDIVTAECVLGMHFFKDLLADVRDIFGGRSATMQNAMREARRTVLQELRREAHSLGADAVVGVHISYNDISVGGSALMVAATGTAVILSQDL